MTDRCPATHPQDETRHCLARGGHASHMDAQGSWENVGYAEQVKDAMEAAREAKRGKRKGSKLRGIMSDAREGYQAILAGDEGPGLDPEIVGRWHQDEWQSYAGKIIDEFLAGRTEYFTTAEDIWPLLDAPEEMRQISVLIRSYKARGLIVEAASKRLRGTYRTKDGVEFQENKLVPVYESRMMQTFEVNPPRWGNSAPSVGPT
jgi:hypothetical protein